MADSISSIAITNDGTDVFKARWGTTVYDYKLNDVTTDFQDLMVAIAEHRATAVEGEVQPLSVRMRTRNKDLDELGAALSDLSRLQAAFKSDDDGDKQRETMSEATAATITKFTGNVPTRREYKMWVEYYIQRIKSTIDSLNNEAQTDMTRLQSLVDRRDESFTTATTLMTNVSDTRDNSIRNM